MTPMLNERTARRALIIIALMGLFIGLAAAFTGRSWLARWIRAAGTLPVVAGLAISIVRDVLAGRMGVDAVAFVSMAAALALGQTLAGVIVAIMYAGGGVPEANHIVAKDIVKHEKDRGRNLDAQGQALLREDLRSPCTEEVAVFHAFSRIVAEARSAFVVLDTAPTGHTLLLMDATGAYHRQMTRQTDLYAPTGRIITPLMRLQDPAYTYILLVTLAETTPVSQASALQEDLRRAQIEPYAWVINKSLLAAGTSDPLLRQRLLGERKQIDRVCGSMAKRVFFVPWQANPPVGGSALQEMACPRPQAPPIF